jgi:hypothetical protein
MSSKVYFTYYVVNHEVMYSLSCRQRVATDTNDSNKHFANVAVHFIVSITGMHTSREPGRRGD